MNYAPFKMRMYAFLLDYLIILIYGVFVVGTIFLVFRSYVTPLFSNSPVTAELTGFLMITLPVSLYFILCERSTWQGTWGKKKLGIRVVDNSGKRISIVRSFFRTCFKFLPWEIAHFAIWHIMLPSNLSENTVLVILSVVYLIVFIYVISPLANKKRKTVYDWVVGTVVVTD